MKKNLLREKRKENDIFKNFFQMNAMIPITWWLERIKPKRVYAEKEIKKLRTLGLDQVLALTFMYSLVSEPKIQTHTSDSNCKAFLIEFWIFIFVECWSRILSEAKCKFLWTWNANHLHLKQNVCLIWCNHLLTELMIYFS